MSIINNGLLLASGADAAVGYQISRSLRFNSADSAYLNRTPASAGNRKTWTWSSWIKLSKITASGQGTTLFDATAGTTNANMINFMDADELRFILGNGTAELKTTQLFRDVSAWYHIVAVLDTTVSSPSSDRMKLYVNGTRVTNFNIAAYPSQNAEFAFNNNVLHEIGRINYSGVQYGYFNGYMADIWFLDGIAATPSDFAETDATTGQWVPKAYTGSYGTNGFRLTFSDNSGTTSTTLGKDAAGSNNWSPNNFSVASGSGNDSLVDSPSSYGTDAQNGGEVRGNYATFNPLLNSNLGTLANGNLEVTGGTSAWHGFSTIAVSSGKWYCEFTGLAGGASSNYMVGIVDPSTLTSGQAFDFSANGYGYRNDAKKNTNNGTSSYGATYTTGDVIGVAFDADNGTLTFYKNGSSQGQAFSGLSTTRSYVFAVFCRTSSDQIAFNAGQRAFAYAAPANHKALCDTNLTAPVIAKPNTVMDVKLWTGNGSTQTISGLGFSPDFVWIKNRSGTGWHHMLFDTIRGVGNRLNSSTTNAELYDSNTLTAFNSAGFSLDSNGQVNNNADTFVGWIWDAGSSAASTNNSGSIQSTVKVNTSAGFSIVTWSSTTGVPHTFGHGLGVAPKFVIVKRRSSTGSWAIGHTSLGWTTKLAFDTSAKAADDSAYWSNTAPTSTVISIGDASNIGGDNIAYCWAPVAGYSSFGSYTGNGSSDGPFVFTGHRSRWIMAKRTDAAGENWFVVDTARDTYNAAGNYLRPNLSNAELASSEKVDILSNGFKIRNADTAWNASGGTYIFASFAEFPFAYARAR